MGQGDDVTPGSDFEAEWAKWQKTLREWRQCYDAWREVLAQLQEWDEKDSKGIALASLDPNFDVFGVTDISDIGEGEPLCGNFEYEDWALLSLKIELHLLVHHFRNDTGGAVLDLSNLAQYYKCYFKKELTPAAFAETTMGSVVALVQDTVVIENTLLEHRLPDDTASIHFLKLTEQQRRDRHLAVLAGDETLVLSFPGSKKDGASQKKKSPPAQDDRANKPQSQLAAKTGGTGRASGIPASGGQKRGPVGSATVASKAPRTRYAESDNHDIERTWGRNDDYGDKQRNRYNESTSPRETQERDRYSHVARGRYHETERYDRNSNDHWQSGRETATSHGRATTGNHRATGEASRSAHQTSSHDRRVPANEPGGGNSRGSSETWGDDYGESYRNQASSYGSRGVPQYSDDYGESYSNQGSSYGARAVPQYSGRDSSSGTPQARAGSTYGRVPPPSYEKGGASSTGYGKSTPPAYGTAAPAYGYGKSTPPAYGTRAPAPAYGTRAPAPAYGTAAPAYGTAAPAYGTAAPAYGKSGYTSRLPPRPQPKVEVDPLDAFMAGIESHGEKFATGEVQEKKAPAHQYDQRYGGPPSGPKGACGGGKSGSAAGGSRSSYSGRINTNDL